MGIRKIIHQLWIPPEGVEVGIPADIERNIKRWDELKSSADHRIWSLDDFASIAEIEGLPIWGAINACRFPTMQANIARLALVYIHGGFWSDLKNLPQRRFLDEISDCEMVLCEHQPSPQRPPGYLTNSFFGASVKHPFIFDCLKEAVSGVMRREEGNLSYITGLVMMNRLKRNKELSEVMPSYRLLTRDDAWFHFMRRTSGSYNFGDAHWSKRKGEPLYIELGAVT